MSKEAIQKALGQVKSARNCHPNAVDTLLFEAEETLEGALAKQPAQQEPVMVNMSPPATQRDPRTHADIAWGLAEKVRRDLDRQSCPGVYMNLAMESIVKHYTTPPAAPVAEQKAFENHWYDEYHSGSISAGSDGRYFARDVQKAWNAWQARAKLATPPAARPAPSCTRSHPHENMDAMCELRTEIARLTNENARLKAQPAPVLPVAPAPLMDEKGRLLTFWGGKSVESITKGQP